MMLNLFKKVFRTQEHKLSKVEYWKKWELFELFDDLHEALKLLSLIHCVKGSEFEKFKLDFEEELGDLEGDNVADFTKIWEWFSPGNKWDNLVGPEGEELGKRIFRRTDRWKYGSR